MRGLSPVILAHMESTMTLSQFLTTYHLSLNQQQQQAVQTLEGPVLLLAVPGSGKTTVLVSRIGYMVLVHGIPPESILTMTYTVSAAQDMRQRFAAIFGPEYARRLEFRTINGVCSRIISCYERMTGRKAYALMEDGREQSALIGSLYHQLTREYATESTIKSIQTAITYVKNQMLRDEELAEVEVDGVEFPALYRAYVQALQQQQKMDYDDQMIYARKILRLCPPVLRHFQQRYRYLCVDEAQDTSKIQHSIISILAQGHQNLFLVGDEDQSIYGFRAAYPQALLHFQSTYPKANVLYMETNYRSTREIVSAAQTFIEKNVNRHPKHMISTGRSGPSVRAVSVRDRKGQYSYLARVAQEATHPIAILYRDNDSAIPIIDVFQRQGIGYSCRQVDCAFFTHAVVRDISKIIRFAAQPQNGALFLDIYYKLGAGISRVAAVEAIDRCAGEGKTILEFLSQCSMLSPWSRKQCAALQTHLDHLISQPAHQAIHRIVHYMGYGKYLEERGGDLRKTEILEALGQYEATPRDLLKRLETLYHLMRQGGSGFQENVILSTIHSSKGLEYPHVILMDVLDGILPKVYASQGEENFDTYQEERRLFYVAMTRAKDTLWVLTFRSDQLTSSFARELFPPQAIPQQRCQIQNTRFSPGEQVRHKSYGQGTILNRVGDIVTVSFPSVGEKKLSISTAVKNHLIIPNEEGCSE